MIPEWDPVTFVNLVLCIIIVILGSLCFRKSRDVLPLSIAGAFGLFGISHAATLLGFKVPLTIPLIIVRTLAYVLVIYALYMNLKNTMIAKEAKEAWADFFKEEARPQENGNETQ